MNRVVWTKEKGDFAIRKYVSNKGNYFYSISRSPKRTSWYHNVGFGNFQKACQFAKTGSCST